MKRRGEEEGLGKVKGIGGEGVIEGVMDSIEQGLFL